MAVAEHAVPQRTPPSPRAASTNPDLQVLVAPRTIDTVPFPPPAPLAAAAALGALFLLLPASGLRPQWKQHFPQRNAVFHHWLLAEAGQEQPPTAEPPLIGAGLGEGLQAARLHRAPSVPWAGKELQHFPYWIAENFREIAGRQNNNSVMAFPNRFNTHHNASSDSPS